ncbi:hypothetical protein J7E32_18275 [Bacillus sp. ISL-55]|nr:hypothetical protein [Bacillus sp. ISL-55]
MTGLRWESEKLSEVASSSDSFHRKQGKAVRNQHKFRQLSQETRKSCPKSAQVQTAFTGNKEKLSEISSSSDSFHRKQGKAVRSQHKFRQLSQKIKKRC